MTPVGRVTLLLLPLLALPLGCRSLGSAPAAPCAGRAVSTATDYLIDRDNARDLAGVLAGYTDDVAWLPPAGEPVIGKAAIEARYRTLFADYQPALQSTTVEAGSEQHIGYVRGFTIGTLTPTAGGPVERVNDKFLAVVRCEQDIWRVSRLSWSPRTAPEP